MLFATIPTMAQQMFIEKDGDTEVIEYSKLDKITFSGTTVNIMQTDGTISQTSMSDVNRIHFGYYSGITDLIECTPALIHYISSNEIAIKCNAGDIINIYDLIGSNLVCTRQKADNGIISIAQLPKGIYIIKVNDRTAKFVKR